MPSRKTIFVYKTPFDTVGVFNYDSSNDKLNEFLSMFNIWSTYYEFEKCSDNVHTKAIFEFPLEMIEMLGNDVFKQVFKRFGVKLTFDMNEIKEID